MLFLPQSLYDRRLKLFRDLKAGKLADEVFYRKLVELEPNDFIGLVGMAKALNDAGEVAAAEECYWRAIQANPCAAEPFMDLARMFYQQPESQDLAVALGELGILKRSREGEDTISNEVDYEKAGIQGEALEEFLALPASTRAELITMPMRESRADESEQVTEKLRPHRLIERMQAEGAPTRETVDEIIAEGPAIVPLLVGVLRAWAQNYLGEDGDADLENALALLGETGSPAEIPHLLEFVDLDNEIAAGASNWALGRIVERHPEASASFLASIVAGLGMAARLSIARQAIRHRAFDPEGKMLDGLGRNLDVIGKADRDTFFPLLLVAMASARPRLGVAQGHAALRRESARLSRDARRECQELLEACEESDMTRTPVVPSLPTVYEICAGDAVWEEFDDDEDDEFDDEGDDEMDDLFLPAAEPVRRRAVPGRNDPCWCNSGKKYKKCHLDADERESRQGTREETEFVNLRRSIGEFLEKLHHQMEIKKALVEFFDGRQEEDVEGAEIAVTQWMIHDWIAPSLRRTVLEQFLVQRGPRLSAREREMVEAWSRSFVGLYEVQELRPGVGVELKDLLLGGTVFVHDVNMSTRLTKWDGLLTRVVPGERGMELAGIGRAVPRAHLEPLRAWLEDDRRELDLPWRDYLKANWPRIRRQADDIAGNWLESLQLTNTDGEELLFSKATYRILNEAALGALRKSKELADESDGDTSGPFVWLDGKKTVLGHVRVGIGELTLECNSRQRLERGKSLLKRIAGDSLRHMRDEFTTQKEMKRQIDEQPRRPQSHSHRMPVEADDKIISEALEAHYRGWPDTKLPALNGKTPRQAVKTAAGRQTVEEVLKFIENGEDGKRQRGEPSFDVGWLRAELGLGG